MKCFTLRAGYKILSSTDKINSGIVHAGSKVYRERNPQPERGILLEQNQLSLGYGFHIPLSSDLLRAASEKGSIIREGSRITLLSASLQRSTNGKLILIPERSTERDPALLLLDIGGGDYQQVKYELRQEQLIAKFSEGNGLNHPDDVVLALLQPGEVIIAKRTSRKYLAWGPAVVREIVHVGFDGANVFYNCSTA